jgi:hypothetical protein
VPVQARAGGRAAEGHLRQRLGRVLDAVDGLVDLRRVAAKLLSQAHGRRIHEVGASAFNHVVKLVGLFAQGVVQGVEGGEQFLLHPHPRGHVHGRRDRVVRRLRHVHVVVRVYGLAAERFSHEHGGPVADDLVGVHVRGGAAPGLEDVEHELLVVRAVDHLLRGLDDHLGRLGVEQAEVPVRLRSGLLHVAEGLDEAAGKAQVANGEVVLGALGLGAVEGVGGHLDGAEGVAFGAGVRSHGEEGSRSKSEW